MHLKFPGAISYLEGRHVGGEMHWRHGRGYTGHRFEFASFWFSVRTGPKCRKDTFSSD